MAGRLRGPRGVSGAAVTTKLGMRGPGVYAPCAGVIRFAHGRDKLTAMNLRWNAELTRFRDASQKIAVALRYEQGEVP